MINTLEGDKEMQTMQKKMGNTSRMMKAIRQDQRKGK